MHRYNKIMQRRKLQKFFEMFAEISIAKSKERNTKIKKFNNLLLGYKLRIKI